MPAASVCLSPDRPPAGPGVEFVAVEERTEKTREPVRLPRFVRRHWHWLTTFDPIGRY